MVFDPNQCDSNLQWCLRALVHMLYSVYGCFECIACVPRKGGAVLKLLLNLSCVQSDYLIDTYRLVCYFAFSCLSQGLGSSELPLLMPPVLGLGEFRGHRKHGVETGQKPFRAMHHDSLTMSGTVPDAGLPLPSTRLRASRNFLYVCHTRIYRDLVKLQCWNQWSCMMV